MPLTKADLTLDIGGFLDKVPGDVVEATFEIASGKYADQVMLGGKDSKPPLVLTLTIESPELEKPAQQSFSVGNAELWEIIDGGKAVINIKDGDKHRFRQGSMAGTLVEYMMKAVGDGDMDKGQSFFIERGHFMTSADFYTGLAWQWEVQEIKRDIGGREVTSRPPLPMKYLGASSSGVASAPAADFDELDALLIANASGKDEKDLRSWAVRNQAIKANTPYMTMIVNGSRVKELEAKGDLTRDPATGKFI